MGRSSNGLPASDNQKTSIWLALKDPVFKGYWTAALVSGTCVAAHNTAAFSVLGQASESTILISLMSTLSSLPFALFTLPAGALADMLERKKVLYGTSLWQASVAGCLTILALTNSLTPYIILGSVFLFGGSGNGPSGTFGLGQYPWRFANEHRRDHRPPHWRISGFALRTGQRIRGQRGRFPFAAAGDLTLEEPATGGEKLHPRILLQQSRQRSVMFTTPRA